MFRLSVEIPLRSSQVLNSCWIEKMVKLRKRQTVVRMKRTSKEEFPHKNFSFSVALDVVAVYVFSHCEILFGNFHNFSLLYRRFLTGKKNFSFSSRFSLSSWTRGSDIFFLLLCFLLSLRKSHSQILVRSSLLLWRYIMLNAQGAKFDISKKARFFFSHSQNFSSFSDDFSYEIRMLFS